MTINQGLRWCHFLYSYVEKISAKEDDAETPTSDVLPYLLKSHVVRYGSKAKQSIMNQLNELICNYPNKDRTIIAYFLSSILNHIGKNKDKCTIFKNDVKGSTVFSFLDLTFYAYSFFPNYGNTQKLLQIISYVRDEYDIFEESTRLQALINKYAFIFDKANINDVVNLFLFCRQAKIEIPYLQEECIVRKIKEKDDPILWATYLMYSQYNRKYSDEIRSCIEKTLLEKINAIRVQKSVYEYREFWWILIFNKCPFITNASQNAIDNAITLLNVPTDSGCTHTLVDIFKNYLQNSPIQFFDWDIERNDFLRTLTFIIAAIGLTTGAIDPDEDYGNEGLSWQKDSSWGSYYVTTLHAYEPVILKNALIYSDNIYFAKAALKIGENDMESSLTKLGFNDVLPFDIKMAKSQFSNTEKIEKEVQLADSGYGQGQILVNPLHMACMYSAFCNEGNMIKPYLTYKEDAMPDVWIKEAFTKDVAQTVLEDTKEVINNPHGTGYAAHRTDIILAGKTGTAEIKASKDDTTGTELGWFSVFTTDENMERPIMIVSMVEDVKGRGGSGYVVKKDSQVLEKWFSGN